MKLKTVKDTIRAAFARAVFPLEEWCERREWRRAWATPRDRMAIRADDQVCANCEDCVLAEGGRRCLWDAFPVLPADRACERFRLSRHAKAVKAAEHLTNN